MTTNQTASDEEKERFIRAGLARVPELAKEILWGLGVSMDADFVTPPEWVRSAIRVMFLPNKKEAREPKPTDFAKMCGELLALGEGAKLMFPQGTGSTSARVVRGLTEEEVKSSVGRAMQPYVGKFEKGFAEIPVDSYRGDNAKFAAFSEGQAEMAKAIASDEGDNGPDMSLTEQLLFLMWLLWPEVERMGSVNELQRWMTKFELLFCSEKLTEKTCRRIGFRPSSRGRKKRIPTL